MEEIVQNPQHYKNLKYPLNDFKRVHTDKSFVLVFTVDENDKKVIFRWLITKTTSYKKKELFKDKIVEVALKFFFILLFLINSFSISIRTIPLYLAIFLSIYLSG
ncbi:hypothetical protein [Methanocaldococcus vulcanius]|uniref:hypothetical protein n=1 Tax=Methanocaldococcus vulcanius TaxID=73913 RepID=UPI0001B0F987|nr:hypothetical protein [Methanocaldococcus vulcanius]